jgi:hypothetical protein
LPDDGCEEALDALGVARLQSAGFAYQIHEFRRDFLTRPGGQFALGSQILASERDHLVWERGQLSGRVRSFQFVWRGEIRQERFRLHGFLIHDQSTGDQISKSLTVAGQEDTRKSDPVKQK